MNKMASGRFSQSVMSEETFDFVCTACEKDNKTSEAVRYCVECVEYCCQVCTDMHKRFPALKNHNLLGVGQGIQVGKQQQPSLHEYPTERCSSHPGKVLDMYCEKDDIVGCTTCISKDHRSCSSNQIHSIPDMINKLFNLADSKNAQRQLRKQLVSIKTVGKSKNVQLGALNRVKDTVILKITKFQKVLEAAIKKASEMSKDEVMKVYKKLEQEILDDKSECQKTNDTLQETSDKLNKAEGNRAQRFVLTKLAQRRITQTEREMNEMNKRIKTGEQISFTPNQSLMDHINDLQGIGIVGDTLKMRSDLYRIVGRKDISIKGLMDSKTCGSSGCCITFDNQLLVADCMNYKLKRFDLQTLTLIDECKLDSPPLGVCCRNKHEAVVTCGYPNYMIQFVSIYNNKMTPTRKILTSDYCYGITTMDDKLYVTDMMYSLHIYNMTGKCLKTITLDNYGNKLFTDSRHLTFNESGDRLYIGDRNKGIICLDREGNYLSTYNDEDMSHVDGVFVDGQGNLFAVGSGCSNIVQFTEDGNKIGVMIKQQDGLQYPRSVCFDKKCNRLFVTMQDSNVVKMYELK